MGDLVTSGPGSLAGARVALSFGFFLVSAVMGAVERITPTAPAFSLSHKAAKVGGGLLQLDLVWRSLEALRQTNQCIGDAASRLLCQPLCAARVYTFATPNGIPFESSEAIDCQPERGGVIRKHG